MSDQNQDDIFVDKELLEGFIIESLESLESLDSLFIELEKNPSQIEIINPIFRAMHSLKGNAPFFGLMKVKALSHNIENLLVGLREKKFSAHHALINHILSGVDLLRSMLNNIRIGEAELKSAQMIDEYTKRSQELAELTPDLVPTAPVIQQAELRTHEPIEVSKTMRVSEERIDTFLSFVGEIIVVNEMLRHLGTKIEGLGYDKALYKDFSQINELFKGLSSGLEKAIMSIRRVSVKALLQRVPRIVRDVADLRHKKIEVQLIGEDLEVDKSLMELLDAPLMHMVRNAADHGIETPDQRERLGKPTCGSITVSIEEEKGLIHLSVIDDGAGLNYEKLREKAVSLGMIRKDQELGEKDLVDLLFLPGVSTAQEVSEISGRGVGLDVVKKSIESAGGKISVTSTQGQGSKFSISIPTTITTQIIQGFIVQVCEGYFVFPVESVIESWHVPKSELGAILDKNGYITRHGEVLPYFSLGELINDPSLTREMGESILMVTLAHRNRRIAMRVDSVIGVRQLVQKELHSRFVNSAGYFLGGAFLGDGSIAFIVDMDRVF